MRYQGWTPSHAVHDVAAGSSHASVAIEAGGSLLVAFTEDDLATDASTVSVRRVQPDGTIGSPEALFSHPEYQATNPRVDVDGMGRGIVACEIRLIDSGQVLLWEDEQPVSMAARVRDLPDGAAVSYVYTPPEARGRGYATHVVHAVTRRILEEGRSFATLRTTMKRLSPTAPRPGAPLPTRTRRSSAPSSTPARLP